MNLRLFVVMHLTAVALGAAVLWWFVFPDRPAEAVSDSITAGAVAGYFEVLATRFFG
jgi:hypothetical protein